MNKSNLKEGKMFLTSKGFGFAKTQDDKEYKISEHNLATALDKDIVEIFTFRNSKGFWGGEVKKIIERNSNTFVGEIIKEGQEIVFKADDFKFYPKVILKKDDNFAKAKVGLKVLISLIEWKDNQRVFAKIDKIIGPKGTHETEILSILASKGFETSFSKEVEDEAAKIKDNSKKIIEEEKKVRASYLDRTTFTIDPEDAKDFDDALSVKKINDDLYEIGVHIADPTHYITPNGAIDKEAQERSTSVYMVDRTIPMLPEVLSNDLCSLNPNEEKLSFSAVFEIDLNGNVQKKWFGKTIIKSDYRFSYKSSQEVLDKNEGPYFKELKVLQKIAKKLDQKNIANGAISFGHKEVKFKLDENKNPLEVYPKEHLETMKIIEDYMLLANKEVANFITKQSKKAGKEKEFIYRIHDTPNMEKLSILSDYLKTIGINLNLKSGEVSQADINQILKKAEGTPEEDLIKDSILRAMSKAVYSTKNIGHFGLAFENYTHFTSPIRRYPDMIVHRLLFKYLNGIEVSKKEIEKIRELAPHTSEQEVAASEAERASIKFKYAQYMAQRIGQEMEGKITGVTKWGIYVQDTKTLAEGLVRISSLKDDFYELDEKNYRIVGQKNKKEYKLSDKVKIKIISVDIDQKNIDFEIVE